MKTILEFNQKLLYNVILSWIIYFMRTHLNRSKTDSFDRNEWENIKAAQKLYTRHISALINFLDVYIDKIWIVFLSLKSYILKDFFVLLSLFLLSFKFIVRVLILKTQIQISQTQ